jgi:C-terminal processing protease CtpA/Prc
MLLWGFSLFYSCTVEEIPKPDTPTSGQDVNQWIEQTMRRYYLWEEEIPRSEQLDFGQDAESFFYSLLTRKDGKTQSGGSHYFYSSINRKSNASSTKAYQGEGYSFGFEFQYYFIRNLNMYALLVLYVIPASPAEQAGIKRGDWIVKINSRDVPGDAQSLLDALDTSSPVTVAFGVAAKPGAAVNQKKLTADKVTDNPVFAGKTLTRGKRKVAYLAYNHFTAGPTEEAGDEQFNNTLRETFRQFKAENPDEFVLDLRYNGGGLVSCARLLATMLAPASALNDVFCKLTYNGQEGSYSNTTLTLSADLLKPGGENLNLTRLYVITSQRTASASEAVINGLKPYLNSNLVIVGDTTEGKNVGSVTFDDDRYEWELHPIVSRLSNKAGFSDYAGGFPPDFFCDESEADTYYDLGDEREYMLNLILEHIAYGTPLPSVKQSSLRSSDALRLEPLYNSLETKKTNGVVLDR